MSNFIAPKLAEPQSSSHARDLQGHLYKEIGISAVAAVLDVMAKPVEPKTGATLVEPCIPSPEILQNQDRTI